MLTQAIRFITVKGGTKTQSASIQLLCHVKPGVSANREGIAAVTTDAIELCVAARPREGEANKAVREVIAEVLRVPKSDVEITKGLKSREKTVVVNYGATGKSLNADEVVERVTALLQDSITTN